MKIALPVADGRVSMHFGHCAEFAIFDVDENEKKITNTTMLTPPPHEPGVLPQWLHEMGANVIITGGMGPRAQQLFDANNIIVVLGAPEGAPEDVADAYINGALQSGANACDH